MPVTARAVPCTPALRAFLVATPSGTPGGVRVRDAEPRLDALPRAVWFAAHAGDELVGAYALVPRGSGWWRCHLTVADPYRDEATRALVTAATAFAVERGDRLVAGSCEESHTALRKALAEAGYTEQARAEVLVWSTSGPDPDCGPVAPHEREAVQAHLDARGVHTNWAPGPETFTVLRRDGAICAGVSVWPLTWHVQALGPGSRLLMPLLRALGVPLDPVHLGAFLGTFGAPQDVARVWRAALHDGDLRLALAGADVADPRWAAWSELPRGRLGRLLGKSTQLVLANRALPRPLDWTEGFVR